MLRRELVKAGSPEVVRIEIVGKGVDVWVGASRQNFPAKTPLAARQLFRRKLNEFVKQRYAETPRSLTRREFTLTEKGSSKFWNIELDGKSHTVRYGRLGTKGQQKTKKFRSEEAAVQDYEKLIEEKVKKGYKEIKR